MTTRQDLHINQGETWQHVHTWLDGSGSPIDISSYTARMSIRGGLDGSVRAYLSTGSDADGGTIALGGGAGTVTLGMSASQSAAMISSASLVELVSAPPTQRAVELEYDLELVSGSGAVTRLLAGRVIVQREVTR